MYTKIMLTKAKKEPKKTNAGINKPFFLQKFSPVSNKIIFQAKPFARIVFFAKPVLATIVVEMLYFFCINIGFFYRV